LLDEELSVDELSLDEESVDELSSNCSIAEPRLLEDAPPEAPPPGGGPGGGPPDPLRTTWSARASWPTLAAGAVAECVGKKVLQFGGLRACQSATGDLSLNEAVDLGPDVAGAGISAAVGRC